MVRHEQDKVVRLGASVVVFVSMSILALDLLDGKSALGQEPLAEPLQEPLAEPLQEPLAVGCTGDLDCSGKVDFGDINPFVLAVSNPGAYRVQFPNCDVNYADTNRDGQINFADINPLVELMSQGKVCQDPNEALTADFDIYELIAVDPNGVETWKKLDFNVPFEAGLRIKLDASPSKGGAFHFDWNFGDGTFGTGREVRHAFGCDRKVTLIVYTEDWGKWASVEKTVRVHADFRYLGATIQPGEPFYPHVACQSSDFVWAISSLNKLGVVRLANANGGEPMQLIACEPLSSPEGMVAYSGYLYIANRANGVPIYAADPSRWGLTGRIAPADMGGDSADHVTAVGSALYVGSDASRRIWVFDMTSPSSPKAVGFVQAPGAIDALSGPGQDYVTATIGRMYAWVLDAVEPKNPKGLPLLTIADSYGTLATSSNAAGVGLNRLTGAQLVQIGRTYDEYGRLRSVSARVAQRVPTGTEFFACTRTRLYATVSAGGVYKYDIADPDDVYCMGKAALSSRDVWATLVFRRESDGAARVLIGCDPVGFLIYAP